MNKVKNLINIDMKKLLGIIAIAAIAAAAGWNFNQSQNDVELSDLALANVEALARNEGSDVNCDPKSNVWCSFVIATPSGNWVEDHPNQTPRP